MILGLGLCVAFLLRLCQDLSQSFFLKLHLLENVLFVSPLNPPSINCTHLSRILTQRSFNAFCSLSTNSRVLRVFGPSFFQSVSNSDSLFRLVSWPGIRLSTDLVASDGLGVVVFESTILTQLTVLLKIVGPIDRLNHFLIITQQSGSKDHLCRGQDKLGNPIDVGPITW